MSVPIVILALIGAATVLWSVAKLIGSITHCRQMVRDGRDE